MDISLEGLYKPDILYVGCSVVNHVKDFSAIWAAILTAGEKNSAAEGNLKLPAT